MFAPRSVPVRAVLRNLRPAARITAPSARICRNYATTTRTKPPTASSPGEGEGGMGQTLFLVAATLTIGGLIISQRGKATNEASIAAARAKAGEGSGRDRKPVEVVETPVQEEEPETVDVPSIVTTKEEEAEQSTQEASSANQGAFNEETGEINWDCPCLGGMADGPCGEDFKAAFSCFVYSEAEPKGVECVEKFKAMQDCFRLHPEIYGEEIDDDEQANAAGSSDSGAPTTGEEIGAVDAPSIQAEAASVDLAVKEGAPSEESA